MAKFNDFTLNLKNTTEIKQGKLINGKIEQVTCYQRGENILPYTGIWKQMIDILKTESDLQSIVERIQSGVAMNTIGGARNIKVFQFIQTLEAMLVDGWVLGKTEQITPTHEPRSGGENDPIRKGRTRSDRRIRCQLEVLCIRRLSRPKLL